MVKEIRIDNYDYELPDERIAKHPLSERDSCKLLVRQADGNISDHIFTELPALLPADSMLIYNNTRVINARLRFHKPEGALIEIFCLEPVTPRDYALNFASQCGCSWLCFVGNSKKWKQGKLTISLTVDGKPVALHAERLGREGNASVIGFTWETDGTPVSFAEIISAAGEIPIPPYLNRNTEASDSKDYQTIYSHIDGSVAAPTAGLHFTDAVLADITSRGIPRRELTLHVGAGTFQPVKADSIGDHEMHSEFIAVSRNLIKELAETSRRVIAVGTTSVRTLESLYHLGCLASTGEDIHELPQWYPYSPTHPNLTVREAMEALLKAFEGDTFVASTKVIIAPGYKYRVVKGMVTNFHQPRSTLLLLVSAFTGGDWRALYDHALAAGYRFLSYGDACLFLD